ncbi:MAG: response regulator [Flammeovirgaceae bacterium]
MQQKKVLLVDDQAEIIQLVGRKLSEYPERYEVINAWNGQIAYEIAHEELPDLIVMDWEMPILDGIAATRKLKESETTFEIPIIIATGHRISPEDLQVALEAGAVDYIRKPIEFTELLARINTALRIREQHEAIKTLLNNEIELKNRQLSSTSMLIVEKNNLLQNFHTDLTSLEGLTSSEQQALRKLLKSMKKRITNHIEIDNSWDTFKIHFEEVHPHFFATLRTRYGHEISEKDIKLCAYIKIGLDNKQISRLLNITPASTSTALFRLKKKLNLPEEVSIRDAVLELAD